MTLDLDTARRIVDASLAHAGQRGVKVTVAVVDASGALVHLSRMNGANFLSPDIATGKAYTAAAWQTSSADVEARGANRATFFSSVAAASRGRAVFGRGALPIVIGGQVVGAAGASGGTTEEDEEIVRAGIAAVQG